MWHCRGRALSSHSRHFGQAWGPRQSVLTSRAKERRRTAVGWHTCRVKVADAAVPPRNFAGLLPKTTSGLFPHSTQYARSASNIATESSASEARKDPSHWLLLRSLWPKEISHNLRIGFAGVGLIISKGLAILAPLQLGQLVDTLGAGVEALPLGLLAAYGLARISTSVFNELRAALFATVSQSSCRALARRSFEHLHGLDTGYLISSKPGALSTVVSRATRSLTQVLNMLLFNVLPIAVEFTLAMLVMGKMGGIQCSMAAAATVGAYVTFTAHFSDKRRQIMRASNKAEEDANSVFFDSLTNCEVVKYFQSEKHETERYDAALARFEHSQVRVLHSLAVLNFGQQMIVVSGFTTILGITTSRVLMGDLPVGDVVAIHGILAQMMQPLGILGGVYRVTTQGFVDLGKLAGFLRLNSSVPLPPGGGAEFEFRGGGVDFVDVYHSYSDGQAVLTGASLSIPAGMRVAIVGPSGSGKSTLLRLLYRLTDPDQGQILIDGQDIKDLSPASFRRHLGIVPQDCSLFNGTVGFNIRYGRPDATEEEVQTAAKLAQIHEDIASMPKGYDSLVGERGLMLSGGQRQRIGIARCLLRNPSIVLLDEATSSLDVRTERLLSGAVDELIRGRTCLIIAHRLATVQRCDSVIFLENGVVGEQGSHDELLAKSDRYRRFWEGVPVDA